MRKKSNTKPLNVVDAVYDPRKKMIFVTVDDGRQVWVSAQEIEENYGDRLKSQILNMLAKKNAKQKVQFT